MRACVRACVCACVHIHNLMYGQNNIHNKIFNACLRVLVIETCAPNPCQNGGSCLKNLKKLVTCANAMPFCEKNLLKCVSAVFR